MTWSEPIDAYCERLGPDFWAEPLNAVTNLAFIAAMAYGLSLALRRPVGAGDSASVPAARRDRLREIDGPLAALALVAGLVGVGSFLFHTVATRWAALADVIPIGVFIALAFGLVLKRLVGLPTVGAIAATIAFMAASAPASALLRPALGSSAAYGPALLALLLIGGLLAGRGVAGGRSILLAGLVFSLSIAMRMADLPLCDAVPTGTHLLWHLLNGLVLALVLAGLARR